ncbi:NAD(P)H-quinone oxidoreductase [Sphingobacterium sp.]|uniref:NAD(P)H-quinone oxidoreductase n=1 Tax=Sphingobacterium sp. TaxID=341027 RepID=UPI00289ECA8F|nr:NAD(P)H-quinone oxidoreductase [Sphingobacterium sp.]
MKAIVITSFGGPEVLKVQERPDPIPQKHELLIRVKAAGINRPDVFQRKGNYPAPEGVAADIPGLEVSGVVEALGAEATNFKVGDEVMALLAGGGYAELVVVNEGMCMAKPRNVSFVEAAGLPETLFTVWHNVFQRGKLQSGENFLVHGGAGGIGTTAIQLAKAFGAHVYTTVGSIDKKLFTEGLGATKAVIYKDEDFVEALADIGMDVILDSIGGEYFAKNIKIMNPDGRLVYINAMQGAKVELNLLKLMQKRISLTGSTLRARDIAFKSSLAQEVEEKVIPLIANGTFKVEVSQVFDYRNAEEAHRQIERKDHFGKIILSFEG